MTSRSDPFLHAAETGFALLGGAAALFATYWDDAWHTDRGRDTFWSAPHLVLYGGVLVALGVAAHWTRRVARHQGWRAALRSGPCRPAVLGGSVVLLSAPVDDLWHRVYGRDAVLWSPPHLLAVAASAALIVGLALGLAPRTSAAVAAAALGLGAYVVPVMEFESDVPQFPAAVYLPVLAAGVVLALPVTRRLVGGRWPLTTAVTAYVAARAAIAAGLAALGHSTPIVPPLLAAAVGADLAARGRRRWLVPVTIAMGLHVASVPVLRLVPHGLRIEGTDIVVSLGLTLLAAAGAATAIGLVRPTRSAAIATVLITLTVTVIFGATGPAFAHDPGQGDRRGQATFTITVFHDIVDVEVDLPPSICGGDGVSIVGRRGGRALTVPADVTASCGVHGRLRVNDAGRWFVYLEQGRLKTWVPVEVRGTATLRATRDLYERPMAPSGSTQGAAGAPLVLGAAALLVAASRAAKAGETHIFDDSS